VKDSKIKKVGEYQEYDIGMILPKKKKILVWLHSENWYFDTIWSKT
jgi:hypothetical protein